MEIPESDEYIFNIELINQHVKRLMKTRTSPVNIDLALHCS